MPLELSQPTPTTARVVRVFDAPVPLIWRAHTEPELVKQWMTGPPGNSMPVCEIDLRAGGEGRFVLKSPEFEMGIDIEYLEVVPGERLVHTENYEGWPEGRCTSTAQLEEIDGQTQLTLELQYLTTEARDAVLDSGMTNGLEASYRNLDALLAQNDSAS